VIERLNHKLSLDEVRCLAEHKVPGRIDSQRAAALLGFAEHDIPFLVAARLLKPLGKPAQNGTKWFATEQIVELSRNSQFLDKATATIQKHWQSENSKKPKKCSVNCSVPAVKSVETVATE
jgi:hypothetical protein